MNLSARNVFKGIISALTEGDVNSEVELTLPGGDKIVAIVTQASVRSLSLAVGRPALACVKAPWVMLVSGGPDGHFSARNQLSGTVTSLSKGAINTEVAIALAGGDHVHAVVNNEAVLELGLKPGAPATALIKASDVILDLPTSATAP